MFDSRLEEAMRHEDERERIGSFDLEQILWRSRTQAAISRPICRKQPYIHTTHANSRPTIR